jgi:hypothetical protein
VKIEEESESIMHAHLLQSHEFQQSLDHVGLIEYHSPIGRLVYLDGLICH